MHSWQFPAQLGGFPAPTAAAATTWPVTQPGRPPAGHGLPDGVPGPLQLVGWCLGPAWWEGGGERAGQEGMGLGAAHPERVACFPGRWAAARRPSAGLKSPRPREGGSVPGAAQRPGCMTSHASQHPLAQHPTGAAATRRAPPRPLGSPPRHHPPVPGSQHPSLKVSCLHPPYFSGRSPGPWCICFLEEGEDNSHMTCLALWPGPGRSLERHLALPQGGRASTDLGHPQAPWRRAGSKVGQSGLEPASL